MARKRMIDPTIWDDEDVGLLSDGAFRVFIACISNADDDGRLQASPSTVKRYAFGFKDRVTTAQVENLLQEIAGRLRSFCRYTVEGKHYIQLLRWNDYQTVEKHKDSIYPPPEEADDTPIRGTIGEQSGTTTPPVGEQSARKKEEKEGTKKEGKKVAPLPLRVEYYPKVSMTEEEHGKLMAEFGEALTSSKIEALGLYKASTGKKYASDYMTILSWDRRDKEKSGGNAPHQEAIPGDDEIAKEWEKCKKLTERAIASGKYDDTDKLQPMATLDV